MSDNFDNRDQGLQSSANQNNTSPLPNGANTAQFTQPDPQYTVPQQTSPAGKDPRTGVYPNAPQPAAKVSGGEMFIGLNILSKIGVIFIIIGVIAFTAVSKDYLSGEIRGGLIYLIGSVMAVAGEIFYRKKSAVFARALTLGAIVEWAVAVPVGYYSLEAFGTIGAIIGAALTGAAGVLFAWRYNSRTVLCTAILCTLPPFFAAGNEGWGIIADLAIILLIMASAYVLADKKDWQSAVWTGLASSFILIWCVMAATHDVYGTDILPRLAISLGFSLLSLGLVTAWDYIRCMRDGAEPDKSGAVRIVLSTVYSGLMAQGILWNLVSRATGGVAVLCIAAVMGVLAIASSLRFNGSRLTTTLVNTVLALIPVGLFSLVSGRWFIVAITAYGAALVLSGLFADKKYLRIWGYSVLGASEFLFITVGLLNSGNEAFPIQFGVNAAVFIAVMICFAVKKHKSSLFSIYSALAIFNLGFFGVYLIYHFMDNAFADIEGVDFYAAAFSALLWLALGFVTGKLSFLEKGASVSSLCLDFLGLCWLLAANISSTVVNDSVIAIVLVILTNIVSLASVLDAVKRIEALSGRAVRSAALIVSCYGLFTTTLVLGVNHWVAFTSCIISIVYLLTAAAWITYGFLRDRPLTRRFGLALALLSSAKLFLIDFSGIGAMGRTLMFIGFGITLLCISFAYGYFEHKVRK